MSKDSNRARKIWKYFIFLIDFSIFFISLASGVLFLFLLVGYEGSDILAKAISPLLGFFLVIISITLAYLRIHIFGRDSLFLQMIIDSEENLYKRRCKKYEKRTRQKYSKSTMRGHKRVIDSEIGFYAGFILFVTFFSTFSYLLFWIDKYFSWDFISNNYSEFYNLADLISAKYVYLLIFIIVSIIVAYLIYLLLFSIFNLFLYSFKEKEDISSFSIIVTILISFISILLIFTTKTGMEYVNRYLSLGEVEYVSNLVFGTSFLVTNLLIIFPRRKLISKIVN